MKKTLSFYLVVVVCLLLNSSAFGQLSGSYTINWASPTGGTNYQTFTAAVTALSTNGVSGPVTFNVQPGTYTEQVSIPAISGASTTNTITFKGSGVQTLLTAAPTSGNRPIISLNSASHITIEDLKIEVTGTDGWGIHFMNHADTNTVTGCHIEGPAAAGIYGIIGSGSTSAVSVVQNNGEYLTITNNTFEGCHRSIQFIGKTGPTTTPSKQVNYGTNITVSGNVINNFRSKAIVINNYHNLTVEENDISTSDPASNGAVSFWDAGDNLIFSKNKVYVASNANNTRLVVLSMAPPNGPAGDATKPCMVTNNFIQYDGSNSGTSTGLLLKNKAHVKVYHNTFKTKNQGTDANCIWLDANNSRDLDSIEIRNNIMYLENSGSGKFIYNATNGGSYKNMVVDHNNYYSPNGYFSMEIPNGSTGTTSFSNFSNYQANSLGYGTGAMNIDPVFVSATDLHATSVPMNDSATVISSITTDIDGDIRSITNPDIGADEFDLPPCPKPYFVSLDSISTTSVRINFTSGGTKFSVEFGPSGFSQGTGTTTLVQGSGDTITGLTPNTTFDFYIRNDCTDSAKGYSPWVGPFTARTLCSYSNNYFTDWDYLSNGEEDHCWTFLAYGSNSASAEAYSPGAAASLQPYTNSNYYRVYNSTQAENFLISPEISDLATNTLQLRFQGSDTYSGSSGTPGFYIGTMSSIGDTGSFVAIDTVTTTSNSWTEFTVLLNAVTVNHKYVVIRHANNADNVFMGIDDLYIEGQPVCTPPSFGIFTDVHDTSVVLSWIPGDGNTFEMEYGTTGFIRGTGTSISNLTDTIDTIVGLQPKTCYEFYIRGNCTVNNSPWYGPVSICTACPSLLTAPFTEDFEGPGWIVGASGATNEIDDCWKRTPSGTSAYRWETNAGNTTSSNTGPISGVGGLGKYVFTEASTGSNGALATLEMPMASFSGLTTPALSFSYHMYGNNINELYVLLDDGTQTDTIWSISGQQQTTDTAAWKTAYVDISSYKSQPATISFVGKRGANIRGDIAIDNVGIDELPSCVPPTNFSIDSIHAIFADFSWHSQSNGNSFKMEYGSMGFIPGLNGTGVAYSFASPTRVTGLIPNTTYDVYLTDLCDSTNWVGPITFTTLVNNDAELQSIISPTHLACGDSSYAVEVRVKNNGLNTITSLPIHVNITGATTATMSNVSTSAIAPGTSAIVSVGTINTFFGGIINIEAYTGLPGDQEMTNDTIAESNIELIAAIPLHIPVDSLCPNDTTGRFVAIPQTGITHNWYANMQDTIPMATGDTVKAQPNQTLYLDRAQSGSLVVQTGTAGSLYGSMFKIYVKNDFIFSGYTWVSHLSGSKSLKAFYKIGDYKGHETTRSSWTLIDSLEQASSSSLTPYRFDFNTPVKFNAGDTISIYLASKAGKYEAQSIPGATIDSVYKTTNDFNYIAGVGGAYFGNNMTTATNASSIALTLHWESLNVCGNKRIALTMGVNKDTAKADFNSVVNLNGADVDFDASSSTGDVYQWNFGDGSAGNGQITSHTYTTPGSYTVTLTVTDTQCGTTDTISKIIMVTIGIEEFTLDEKVEVYPNPNNGVFTIGLNLKGGYDVKLFLSNTLGQIVYKRDLGHIGAHTETELNLGKLAPGVYHLHIQTNSKTVTTKVTIL